MKKLQKFYLVLISILLVILACAIVWVCVKAKNLSSKTDISGEKHKTARELFQKKSKKSEEQKIENFDETETEVPVEKENSFVVKSVSLQDFDLSRKAKSEIADYVCTLSGELGKFDSQSEFLNNVKIYPEKSQFIKLDLDFPCIYVFSPCYNGICDFGFCDDAGNWLKTSLFVAVFNENGEMLSVSQDYTLENNAIEVQLYQNEFYYVVCGKIFGTEDVSSINLKILQKVRDY